MKQQFLSGSSSRGRALTDEYGGRRRGWYEIRTNDDEVEKDNYDDEENIENSYRPKSKQINSIRCDEGPILETSAIETLYGGQITLSIQLIKLHYDCKYMKIVYVHCFFRPYFHY